MGVQPAETLLIGNCPENDVVPAQAQGWQIWHLTGDGENPEVQTGAWGKLGGWFGERRRKKPQIPTSKPQINTKH
jgi:FMN phosphatase YigB (HAD superfamily)